MSGSGPEGLGGFFPGLLGDLLNLLRTDGPFPYELAVQLAQSVAAEGADTGNVEPIERIRIEELTRIAELHVADVTGMTTTPSGRPIGVIATSRVDWARHSLEDWRELLEKVAGGLIPAPGETPIVDEEADPDEDQMAALFAKWTSAMAPAMVAMQFGSFVGHLATRALGQYELPLPRRNAEQLVVVPGNDAQFAADWSLPNDDVTLFLAVRDVATHAVLSRAHVRTRLEELLVAHAGGFRPDPRALEEKMGDAALGPSMDITALTQLLGDPSALGELVDTPELRRTDAQLATLGAAIAGYVEWVADTVAARAIGAAVPIREAMRRRRMDPSDDERAGDALFGLLTGQQAVDRGEAFVRGVLERGGERDLAKLWVVEANLPTPAELDAPGLWIERGNLPPDPARSRWRWSAAARQTSA